MQMSDEFPMMMEREAGLPENVPKVAVWFGLHPKIDRKATAEEGREVYRDVEYCRIEVPGDKSSLYFQPATDDKRRRYPRAYAAYKARNETPMIGTPIETVAWITRATAMNLRALNIATLEALAEVSDGHIDKLGTAGREWRERARVQIKDARDSATSASLVSELRKRDETIAGMQAQIQALQAEASDGEDVAARARRPRKVRAEA